MLNQEISVLIAESDLETQRLYRQRLIHDPTIKLIGICSSMSSANLLLSQTSCDLLITEIDLPDGNGADLISTALNNYGVRNCVVISSKSSISDIKAAIENGATGYILKGEPEALDIAACVRVVASGGSPISPPVARVVLDSIQIRKGKDGRKKDGTRVVASPNNPLSPRESEILELLAKGMSFSEISKTLQISCHTVTAHFKKIYRKLQVHSRGEAVYEASQLGILEK